MKQGWFHTVVFCLLAGAVVSLPGRAYTQQIPPSVRAGAVEKELARERRPPLEAEKKIPFIELKLPKEELVLPEGIQVFVKEIRITGNTVIQTKKLKQAVSKYENKTLGFKELNEACLALTQEYRQRGYFLAKAYLPVQEINEGLVEVSIVEGRLGYIDIQGNHFYKTSFFKRYLKVTRQGVICYSNLLRSLLLLNEYPGLTVKAILVKGKEVGTANLVVMVSDRIPLAVSYDFNNFGSRYVTRQRNGLSVRYCNLVFGGDQINLRGTLGCPVDMLKFGRAEYWIPVNGYGTKLGGSYTITRFKAGREYKKFDTLGGATIYSLGAKHPVVRTRALNLDAEIGFDYKQIFNKQLPVTHEKDELRILRQSVTFDWVDPFYGRTYAGLEVGQGVDLFGASPQDNSNMSHAGAGGKFTRLAMNLSRVQRLPFSSFLVFRGVGQGTPSKLASSEQISIGGADSVRGYPQSDFLGDWGFNFNIELYTPPGPFVSDVRVPVVNKKIKELMQFVLFLDYGSAYILKAPAGTRAHEHMTGIGPGLRFNLPFDISVRLDWGFSLGSADPSDTSSSAFYIQVSKALINN